MKIIDHPQGSEAWLAHRRTTRNASDAPALMGASPYVTRAELVRRSATGIEKEIDAATQRRFDKGHAVEPALRALAEDIIGEELFPVTAVSDDGYLGASFDGVTMSGDIIFEAKQSNFMKEDEVRAGRVPDVDYWQVVQQFAVNDSAMRCLYMVGNGLHDQSAWMYVSRESIGEDIKNLRAAWKQFDADVAAYQPEAAIAEPVSGNAPDQLPAIRLELTGMVTASNLKEFKEKAVSYFKAINQDLQTDQDFADAEQDVKFCSDIEAKIEAAKMHALSQTQSIDELFRTLDEIKESARRKRLDLDKLVKSRKEAKKAELVQAAISAVRTHEAGLNNNLGAYAMSAQPTLPSVCAEAIKGKRSFSAMKDALDGVVAQQKISANQEAEMIRENARIFENALADHGELFPDHVQLVLSKDPEDLQNLIDARIAEKVRKEEERRQAEAEAQRAKDAKIDAELSQFDGETHDPAISSSVATVEETRSAFEAAPLPKKLIKLGELNDLIAPLKIDSEGLAKLGFPHDASDKRAKLYDLAMLPKIVLKLCSLLNDAVTRAYSAD